MFDRLQRPFLTVETGEAYQPIRLTYEVLDAERLINILEQLQCVQKNPTSNSWSWYWKAECENEHFESIDSFRKNPSSPIRLGTLTLRDSKLYINLPTFKRACIAVPFFYRILGQTARLISADFINKVFALDERLPHGFVELFKDEELDRIVHQRVEDYHTVKEQCEQARTPEEAFQILSDYTHSEARKRLPYAERYVFELDNGVADIEVVSLAFYIFLRGRELVAIKRWLGQAGYSLADAADETVAQVFGGLDIDVIE